MYSRVLALIVVSCFLAGISCPAVTFTNLYKFSLDTYGTSQFTNFDGISPDNVVVSGNTIFGTTASGGINGFGTVFRVNTDGTHFTNLFNFNRGTYDPGTSTYIGNTGVYPCSGLVLVSNVLYGTTHTGGKVLAGNVFKINTDGSGFATIHEFNYIDGQGPQYGLTLYSNALYGATVLGGSNGFGNVFKVNLGGSPGISFIYQFTNQVNPYSGFVMSSNNIYGLGYYGGSTSNGLLYRVSLSGNGFADLYDFNGTNGSRPWTTPILSSNTIYAATYQGGTNGNGNIFRINTDGTHYTNLYSFTPNGGANVDGTYPYDYTGLILSGNKLYGTASGSGSGGQGTVFQINIDGTGYTVLHSFNYADGSSPVALALSGGTLYGVNLYGIQGNYLGNGSVFALSLQPTLNMVVSTNRQVLTWNDPTYFLYNATNLAIPFAKITNAVSPYTNSVAAKQRFFQLRPN